MMGAAKPAEAASKVEKESSDKASTATSSSSSAAETTIKADTKKASTASTSPVKDLAPMVMVMLKLRPLVLGSIQIVVAACAGVVLLPVLHPVLHTPFAETLVSLQRQVFVAVVNGGMGPFAQVAERVLAGPLCLPALFAAAFSSLAVVRGCSSAISWGLVRLYQLFQKQVSRNA